MPDEFVAHSDVVTCAHLGRRSVRIFVTGSADNLVKLWALGKTEPSLVRILPSQSIYLSI